jgi:nicotinate-nucleotide adenylyltransferase
MAGKKIGLFFGSFNPIHNGHLMIANYVAEFTGLDQVWFVISPMNPFKTEQYLLADYHRRELLTRAIGDYPKFRVSAVEFHLPKPSYTIDTLTFLKKEYPENQFSLIIGSDQLPNFHRWKKPEQILDGYKVLVYPRPQGTGSLVAGQTLVDHPSVTRVEAPMMEISSSFIRESIKMGKDVRFFMPELTWQYIDEMHFYKATP